MAARILRGAFGFAAFAACLAGRVATARADEPALRLQERSVAILALPGERKVADSILVAAGAGLVDLDVSLFAIEVPASADELDPASGSFFATARAIAAGAGALAAIWVDRRDGGAVYAVAGSGASEGVIERRVGEFDPDAQIEAMAVIIRTLVEQISSGNAPSPEAPREEIPVPVDPPRAVEPPREPPPPAPRGAVEKAKRDPVGLTQETEYAMHCGSRDLGAVHGVNLRIGASVMRRVALYAGYTLLSAAAARSEPVDVELTRHPVHLGVKLRLGDRRIRGFAEVNLIIDYAVLRLSSLSADLVAEDANSTVQASTMAALGIGFRAHEVVTLYAAAGAEIPFNPVRYAIGSAEREVVLSDPWHLQPWVLAGLILDLL